ncbi:MAG TPA: hypothetical protein VI140_03895 [Oxalicibacterium sp.]
MKTNTCKKTDEETNEEFEQGRVKNLKGQKKSEEEKQQKRNADKREEESRSPVFTGSRAACKTMQAGARQKKELFLEVSLLQHLGKFECQIKPRENP